MMRKLRRSILKTAMREAGIQKVNRVFSIYWRREQRKRGRA